MKATWVVTIDDFAYALNNIAGFKAFQKLIMHGFDNGRSEHHFMHKRQWIKLFNHSEYHIVIIRKSSWLVQRG